MNKLSIKQVLLAAAFAAAAPPLQANLLTNGSFESGTFNPPASATMSLPVGSTAITGWTVFGDVIAWIGAGNPWGLTANDGSFFLDLTDFAAGAPFGGVTQTIATVAGATYALSFDLGSSTFWGRPSAIIASAAGVNSTFTSPASGGNNDWQQVSMSFVALADSTAISLRGATGFNYIGLDNVSVVFVDGPGTGGGTAPEPGSLALMLAAAAALVALRLQRRNAG